LNPEEFTEFNGIKMDATDIQYEDNEFDVVICNHILEHIIDDVKAMKEIYRVLKPGGFAILQTPIAMDLEKSHEDYSITTPKERKLIYGQFDHVRLYGFDYFERLASIGFRVERDHPKENHWADNLEKHRLRDSEEVIVCHKD